MSTRTSYHHGNLAEAILLRSAEVIAADGMEALTLRGVARDLGVSHGAPNKHFRNKAALLTALAAKGWLSARDATLAAADSAAAERAPAHARLNAMGRGYMRWAFSNPALFRCVHHPDVNRYASEELKQAIEKFARTLEEAVAATQAEGRHPNVSLEVLTLFTNAVPTGAALLLMGSIAPHDGSDEDLDALIEPIINLVVPVSDSAET